MVDAAESSKPHPVFTSADHIRQLNEVDKDVARLIHSAGLAIQALTNARSDDSMADTSLDSHKARFQEATSRYFALLSSIDVRLRRQVYALEEASILGPESTSRGGETAVAAGAGTGAANPLDISWLNSRKDTVGKDKEAELWAAARGFVEQISNSAAADNSGVKSTEDGHERMQTD